MSPLVTCSAISDLSTLAPMLISRKPWSRAEAADDATLMMASQPRSSLSIPGFTATWVQSFVSPIWRNSGEVGGYTDPFRVMDPPSPTSMAFGSILPADPADTATQGTTEVGQTEVLPSPAPPATPAPLSSTAPGRPMSRPPAVPAASRIIPRRRGRTEESPKKEDSTGSAMLMMMHKSTEQANLWMIEERQRAEQNRADDRREAEAKAAEKAQFREEQRRLAKEEREDALELHCQDRKEAQTRAALAEAWHNESNNQPPSFEIPTKAPVVLENQQSNGSVPLDTPGIEENINPETPPQLLDCPSQEEWNFQHYLSEQFTEDPSATTQQLDIKELEFLKNKTSEFTNKQPGKRAFHQPVIQPTSPTHMINFDKEPCSNNNSMAEDQSPKVSNSFRVSTINNISIKSEAEDFSALINNPEDRTYLGRTLAKEYLGIKEGFIRHTINSLLLQNIQH
ncbi:hypothetical protein H4Q26_007374 [Puccinia striiformis f. sp. tritici PST-130]|nr:hypothetical protein H4Q26_007374 [Puccinia striiformis f. sp. tritici PST-130]